MRGTSGGLVEVRIGWSDGAVKEIESPCDVELAEVASALEPGEEMAVPTGAFALIDELSGSLSRGYALLIDFGTTSSRTAGPVHGYHAHRIVEDVLGAEPGTTDITAGVDFPRVAKRARYDGLTPTASVSQRSALLSLGFERWAIGERAVRAWSGRSRAMLLVDPDALGRLRWLGLATQGLGWPPWMGETESQEAGWNQTRPT